LLATIDQELVNGTATGTAITRYNHPDNLGSTNVTSDSSGNLAQSFDYAPYGSVLASTITGSTTAARQFIGQFSDASGLSYLNARYYNPSQGQFLSEDPVFLSNPSQQKLQDPQSLNTYSYSEDNPIVKEDQNGLTAVRLGFVTIVWNVAIGGGITVGTTDDGGYSAGPYFDFGPAVGAELSGPEITTANVPEQYLITVGGSASGGTGDYGVEISKDETYYPYSKKGPQTSQEATVGLIGGLGAAGVSETYVPLVTRAIFRKYRMVPLYRPLSTIGTI
jgi:RHS repeat-associated protein